MAVKDFLAKLKKGKSVASPVSKQKPAAPIQPSKQAYQRQSYSIQQPKGPSVGSRIKSLFKKSTPAIAAGGVAVGAMASSAGSAVGRGARAGARAAGGGLLGAVKTESLMLFIIGLVHFFFIKGTSYHSLFSGMVLLPLGALTFFNYMKSIGSINSAKGGWFIVILFGVWYVLFGRSQTGLIVLGVMLVIFSIAYGLATKWDGLKEILLGFVPLIFLFLDVGALSAFFQGFGIEPTDWAIALMLWVPWWAMLGLFTLPSGGNAVTLLKMAGIFYIAAVMIIPLVSSFGPSSTVPFSLGEFVESQKGLEEQFSEKENPAYSQLVCVFYEQLDVSNCVAKRQQQSEYKAICKSRELKEGTTEFNNCIKEQEEIAKEGKSAVGGSITKSLSEFTQADLSKPKDFPRETTNKQETYPAILSITNPGKEEFGVEANCVFKKGKVEVAGQVSIDGKVGNALKFNKDSGQLRIGCKPATKLSGTYKLEYNVKLVNVETFSYLSRVFSGKDTDESLLKEVETDKFSKVVYNKSQSAGDLAILNFRFGSSEGDGATVNVDNPVLFIFNVENKGKSNGKVVKINNYEFTGLIEKGFSVDQTREGNQDCLQGGEILVTSTQTKERRPQQLKSCYLQLAGDLKSVGRIPIVDTFTAKLDFDYEFTTTETITVK
ncbi:MAG: hypothetical protein KKA62_02830 [Nanoarchaeota archaeon]|nr:hypothetical protein [Nanoarchaeota archaeon]MBU1644214.1 hypothetical protein [Nanoarchaeota archaeon]MBU1976866.1 hypothetical protein [Nanoarchaeota archaeon]